MDTNIETLQVKFIDARYQQQQRRQAQLDLPNNATADWQAVEVGQPVQRGDIFRFTIGTEIVIPSAFYGNAVLKPDFVFRKPVSVPHTKDGKVVTP